MKRISLNHIACIVQVAVFILPIFAGFIWLFLPAAGSGGKYFENFPVVNRSSFNAKEYVKSFDSYVNNNFGLRSFLLDSYGKIQYRVFHQSFSDQVLAGKNDWLYYTLQHSLEDIWGQSLLSPEQAQQWDKVVTSRAENLAKRNIQYKLVIVPDKHTLYPEFLPERILKHRRASRFLTYKNSTTENQALVDLYQPLQQTKSLTQLKLYYHGDTHWTPYGAFIGGRYLLQALGGKYASALQDVPEDSFSEAGTVVGDLARIAKTFTVESLVTQKQQEKSKSSVYFRQLPIPFSVKRSEIIREGYTAVNASGSGTALVFQDSFGPAMEPFLYSTFKRTSFCWAYPDDNAFYSYVNQEKPDVVVEIRVERLFYMVPKIDTSVRGDASVEAIPSESVTDKQKHLFSLAAMLSDEGKIEYVEGKPQITTRQGLWAKINAVPGSGGQVESVTEADGSLLVKGWAFLVPSQLPALHIMVANNSEIIFFAEVNGLREDVYQRFNVQGLLNCGFSIEIPAALLPKDKSQLQVYAVNGKNINILAK